jgi:hypothetical protein
VGPDGRATRAHREGGPPARAHELQPSHGLPRREAVLHQLARDHLVQVAVERAVQLLVFLCVEAFGAKVHPPDPLCMNHTSEVVFDTKFNVGNRLLFVRDGVGRFHVLQRRGEALHRGLEVSSAVHDHVCPHCQDCIKFCCSFSRRYDGHPSIRALESYTDSLADVVHTAQIDAGQFVLDSKACVRPGQNTLYEI